MSQKIPRVINYPVLGQLISVDRTAAAIDNLLASGAVRQVHQNGYLYVLRADIEPYCVTDIEEAFDRNRHAESDWDANDQLRNAIQLQAATDVQLIDARKALVRRVVTALQRPATTNAFARTLAWPAIWETVAFICINTASDVDAERIGQAYHDLSAHLGDHLINESAFSAFHRALLCVAAPQLDGHFAEIWRKDYGRISLPDDPRTQIAVLNVLGRFVALIGGFNGDPEGAENASSIMANYFQFVRVGG